MVFGIGVDVVPVAVAAALGGAGADRVEPSEGFICFAGPLLAVVEGFLLPLVVVPVEDVVPVLADAPAVVVDAAGVGAGVVVETVVVVATPVDWEEAVAPSCPVVGPVGGPWPPSGLEVPPGGGVRFNPMVDRVRLWLSGFNLKIEREKRKLVSI